MPPGSSLVMAQDANGNQITTNSNPGTSIIDTLGQTVLTGMSTLNGVVQTWGTLSYQNSAGSTFNTTPTLVPYTLSNISCGAGSETTSSGSLLDHLTLPDGRKYSFTYESNYANTVTGRLSKVTLPSGGSISYSYGCLAGTPGLTRVVNDNNGNSATWTYTNGTNASGQKTMTMVDPAGTTTVITYQLAELQTGPEPYTGGRYLEIGRQTSNSSGTLLSTVTTSYVGAQTNSTYVLLPIKSSTRIVSLPSSSGVLSETYTAYSTIGLVTEVDTFDFGTVGGGVGPLLSKVLTFYGTSPSGYPGSSTPNTGALASSVLLIRPRSDETFGV